VELREKSRDRAGASATRVVRSARRFAPRACGLVFAWAMLSCGDSGAQIEQETAFDSFALTHDAPQDVSTSPLEIDILPDRYPNLLAANEPTLSVAVLSPRRTRRRAPLLTQAWLQGDGSAQGPRVEAVGGPRQRDVNGDGYSDLVFTFSRPLLEQSGLLNDSTTRLALVARSQDLTERVGVDRLFTNEALILRLTEPSGPAPVGTQTLSLVDATRTVWSGRARTLLVRTWYPAEATGRQPAPYFLDPREADANAPIPHLFDSVHASSVRDAPVAYGPRRRPMLVLSTGLGVFLSAYTTLAEQLASQGYFVFGIEHPGGSGNVVLPDGTLVPLDPQLEVPTDPILAETAEEFARDIEAVTTAALDANSSLGAFAGSLDAARVGALGHSLGGAASVLAAGRLETVRAAVNLDGSFRSEALATGPNRPVLLMSGDGHRALDESLDLFFANARARVFWVEVAGSAHMNFSDAGFYLPLLEAVDPTITADDLDIGTIDPSRMRTIMLGYVSAFFDKELRGARSDLLMPGSKRFPEAPLVIVH
jgi:dienelactone hydrolase